MNNNYDILLEHNRSIAQQCIAADALVKTFPSKAAILYGKAMETFLAVICCDNDIAFDRSKDLTPINMIGSAYSCGVISKYEKGVLDDLRYAAYLAERPELAERDIDTHTLLDKVISFFGMVMRYYQLEDEQYKEDVLPLGGTIIRTLKSFEMDTAYDKVYLVADEEGNLFVTAQYIRHSSDLADEVFSALERNAFESRFSSCVKTLRPEILAHQPGNNLICVRTAVPKSYVTLVGEDFSELYTEQRIKFIINTARLLSRLHSSSDIISFGGFAPEDIWLSYKGMTPLIAGLESKVRLQISDKNAVVADIKSFAALCACLLPEYEAIPVAGLLIKHILMGSGKSDAEKLYSVLKKEASHIKCESKQLKELIVGDPFSAWQSLCAGIEISKPAQAHEPKEKQQDVDFDEMYSKIFN